MRVVVEEVGVVVVTAVGNLVLELERGFFGEVSYGPDLAMGMRVRATHGGAFVFEDLHVAVLMLWFGDEGVRVRSGEV